MGEIINFADHRKRHNQMIIARMKGMPAQVGTPETDADPNNPNVSGAAKK